MNLIADGLLIATALTAGLYCLVLSRRLRNLTETGGGIGAQIESLDRALNETRGALTETRESVGELRASAKSALTLLARETAQAAALAERIEAGVAGAEATMQRLYQAETRIEAHQKRLDRAHAAPPAGGAVRAEDAEHRAERGAGSPEPVPGGDGQAGEEAAVWVARAELPDGGMARASEMPAGAGPDEPDGGDLGRVESGHDGGREVRAGRGAGLLKAERMVL
jgi:hypothetical protein